MELVFAFTSASASRRWAQGSQLSSSSNSKRSFILEGMLCVLSRMISSGLPNEAITVLSRAHTFRHYPSRYNSTWPSVRRRTNVTDAVFNLGHQSSLRVVQFDHETSTVAFEPNDAADITSVIRTRKKIPEHLPVYMFEAYVEDAADAGPASRIGVPQQSQQLSQSTKRTYPVTLRTYILLV